MVSLPEDDEARLRQLQELVGGCIEAGIAERTLSMVINENGKDGPHMINHTATAIAHEAEAIMSSDYRRVAVILPAEVLTMTKKPIQNSIVRSSAAEYLDLCCRQRPRERRSHLCQRKRVAHPEDDGLALRRGCENHQLPPENGVCRQ